MKLTTGHDVLIVTYHTVTLAIYSFIYNDKITSYYHMATLAIC